MIYAKDGSSYTVSHWSEDGKTIYLADGTTVGWNRGTITKADGSTVQMDHYEVLGTKYVPVRVATSDLADFCSKYTVVENGGQLVGGYSEKNLTAYTLTAAVDENTNGLKYATKSGDGYTFSAAHTGTGSGVAEAAQKAADGLTVNLRSGSDVGSFGEFIRLDLNGNYGELGSRMQSVVWTYYGDDSTYTHAKASYGTKFAADNWMHKSMGIQLGLSDSARCPLPAAGGHRWHRLLDHHHPRTGLCRHGGEVPDHCREPCQARAGKRCRPRRSAGCGRHGTEQGKGRLHRSQLC